jgi:hypothetical protein
MVDATHRDASTRREIEHERTPWRNTSPAKIAGASHSVSSRPSSAVAVISHAARLWPRPRISHATTLATKGRQTMTLGRALSGIGRSAHWKGFGVAGNRGNAPARHEHPHAATKKRQRMPYRGQSLRLPEWPHVTSLDSIVRPAQAAMHRDTVSVSDGCRTRRPIRVRCHIGAALTSAGPPRAA